MICLTKEKIGPAAELALEDGKYQIISHKTARAWHRTPRASLERVCPNHDNS
jgi:hypothetical protein